MREVPYSLKIARGESRKSRPISNPQAPTYDDMLDSLVEQVLEKIGATATNVEDNASDLAAKYEQEIKEHKDKLNDMLEKGKTRYDELIEERNKHIISEDLHTGFDSTLINKNAATAEPSTSSSSTKTQSIEVINSPEAKPAVSAPASASTSAPAASVAAATDDDDDDPDNIKPSAAALEFSKIPIGEYDAAESFLHKHREIVSEREKDALMMEAFAAQFAGDEAATERIVYNALILQYSATFGPDGIRVFFARVLRGPEHARASFLKDVEFTTNHIKNRCRILSEQEKASGEDEGEAIVQLQPSLASGDNLSVVIPPENSEDENIRKIREAYDTLSPELRTAVESKSLKSVNKVLATMTFEEGEAVIQFFEATGIFDIDGNVYDEEDFKKIQEERAKEAAAKEEVAKEEVKSA